MNGLQNGLERSLFRMRREHRSRATVVALSLISSLWVPAHASFPTSNHIVYLVVSTQDIIGRLGIVLYINAHLLVYERLALG